MTNEMQQPDQAAVVGQPSASGAPWQRPAVSFGQQQAGAPAPGGLSPSALPPDQPATGASGPRYTDAQLVQVGQWAGLRQVQCSCGWPGHELVADAAGTNERWIQAHIDQEHELPARVAAEAVARRQAQTPGQG